MKTRIPNNAELSEVLAKMADLPTFVGVKLTSVHDRGLLGDTPLHVAAIWGNIDIGKILLDAGANLNVPGEYGNTPLHEAIRPGNEGFVRLLLSRGALKDPKNQDGLTPADLARALKIPEIEELLR